MFDKFKERRETIKSYKRLFDTVDGQAVIRDLMKSCHVYTTTLDRDPLQMAYNEGARSIILRILNTINIDPEQMKELMKLSTGQMEDEYETFRVGPSDS